MRHRAIRSIELERHERRIVRFLSSPAAYPHPVGTIERRETHVSHVFLAGPFAYKLKKPVRFPFLDASILARRKRFCELELSLNRRLAPDVYLGLVPIRQTRLGPRLGGRAGKVIEWVVQMRRLPEARMLDRLVSRRRVARREMERLADRLIRFFQRAARGRRIDRYGAPRQVEQLVMGNLHECRPFVGRLLSLADWRALEAAYRQYLALHGPLLSRRVREGRIIDGHGDLRCENICMTNPVSVFDCVEFEPAFRCGDLVNDFSFLLMDLEFRGRRDLAQALIARYRRRLNDPTLARVLPFYQCHRSLVRGKVRALAWLQHPKTHEGLRVRRLARRHFALARRYARAFAPPRLIVVGGLIGTGKSTLAKPLADALGMRWLRTDEIRLREFAHKFRSAKFMETSGFAEGLYAPQISRQVYQRLTRRAEALVRQGHSVVCDGTFSMAAGREALRRIARRHHAAFHFFECVAPRAVAVRRVATRYAGGRDLSEARPTHYERLRAGFEPVHAWPAHTWTRLTTHRSPHHTYLAALEALRRAWLPGSS